MEEKRHERWESLADAPLTAAAVVFLAAYAVPILDPGLSSEWAQLCRIVVLTTWLMFALDYIVRLGLSVNRVAFVKRNVLDLLVVALPLLRPLRLLRLIALLSVLNRYAGNSLRGRVAMYVGGSISLIVFVSSLAVLDAERRSPDANIKTFGDAVWWAMTTISTVGYGDQFPVTTTGRLIAASLMIAGIALLGVVTASVATWLIEKVQDIEDDAQAATRRDIRALTSEVRELREALSQSVADPS